MKLLKIIFSDELPDEIILVTDIVTILLKIDFLPESRQTNLFISSQRKDGVKLVEVRSDDMELRAGNLNIGNPRPEEAKELMNFKEKVHGQTRFLRRRPEELELSEENERELIKNYNEARDKILIVARHDDKIVGYLVFRTSELQRYNHQGELRMSVDKDYWGRGIGSSLVKFLIDWGENNGLKRIELLVDEHNDRAINLYRKFGFREEGRLKKRRKLVDEDEYEDEIIMSYIYR